ncbi:CDP-glucose 4,6-dehydratase [Actinospongicola halichondriae]|uniref:CDP-glucose 4,6-dehydratase n=1 Tax=Actinospongicola halichondriae TaxID=3236844 RepID=UPI003D52051D
MDGPVAPTPRIDPAAQFAGRKVLLTGHTGFKGSWLATWLDLLGADVAGYSDEVPKQGAFHDLGVDEFVESHFGDVGDVEALGRTVDAVQPDVVFHLAAQPLVRASWRDRISTFATNVMGTVHAVETALACPSVQAIVVITTDKVYENDNLGRSFREGDPLGGHDPYSASKAAAEIVLSPYRDASHMGLDPRPLVSVRAGNVIGGGDWSDDRLVPDIVRALAAGEQVTLRRPDAVRPWQHVLDCLSGYLLVSAAMLDGRPVADSYNFAHSAGEKSVLDVARRAAASWGAPDDAIVIDRDDSTAEATLLQLDATLAMDDLGWGPRWSVDQAIDETIRFYRSDEMAALGRRQIEEHTAASLV